MQNKLDQSELHELFGDYMPMDAVKVYMTHTGSIEELRAELASLAARYKTSHYTTRIEIDCDLSITDMDLSLAAAQLSDRIEDSIKSVIKYGMFAPGSISLVTNPKVHVTLQPKTKE